MLPVTLAASWAYILPVSTPPNAIAYSYGDIEIMDMVRITFLLSASKFLVFNKLTIFVNFER